MSLNNGLYNLNVTAFAVDPTNSSTLLVGLWQGGTVFRSEDGGRHWAQSTGTIGEYTTAGAAVNPALISGLIAPYAFAVVATVPEPGSCALALFGLVLAGLAIKKVRKHNEKADTNGPHFPGIVGRRTRFAYCLEYRAPLMVFMTA